MTPEHLTSLPHLFSSSSFYTKQMASSVETETETKGRRASATSMACMERVVAIASLRGYCFIGCGYSLQKGVALWYQERRIRHLFPPEGRCFVVVSASLDHLDPVSVRVLLPQTQTTQPPPNPHPHPHERARERREQEREREREVSKTSR